MKKFTNPFEMESNARGNEGAIDMKDKIDGLATKLELVYNSGDRDKIRMDKLEDEVSKVNTLLNTIETRLENKMLEQVINMAKRKDADIYELSREADSTMERLEEHGSEVFKLKEKVLAAERRLVDLEDNMERLEEDFLTFTAKNSEEFPPLRTRLDALEKATVFLPEALNAINERLNGVD